MGFEAKVIEDSTCHHGIRLCTLQLKYPRFIHAEFMTHRVFSRNASSSRAIPVAKMIEQVRNDPAMPIHWGKNQPGMQAWAEHDALVEIESEIPGEDPRWDQMTVQDAWRTAAKRAAEVAVGMDCAGYHKQIVNRILEPFQWISVIVTATEWDNFFELRDHEDAQPEIRHLAQLMRAAMDASKPVKRSLDFYSAAAWHLPYVTEAERIRDAERPQFLAKLSAARCARVSYLTHDGKEPNVQKDIELYERLVGSRPLHASPIEHQARATGPEIWSGNFKGWVQFRKLVEVRMA